LERVAGIADSKKTAESEKIAELVNTLKGQMKGVSAVGQMTMRDSALELIWTLQHDLLSAVDEKKIRIDQQVADETGTRKDGGVALW